MSNPFKFCMQCGTKNFQTAKLCCDCGVAFPGFTAIAKTAQPTAKQKVILADNEETEDDNENVDFDVSNMTELDVEIDVGKPNRVMFEQVANERPSSEKFKRPTKKLTKKQFEEQWKSEAGSTGRGNSQEIA